jgi:hypothetical protein
MEKNDEFLKYTKVSDELKIIIDGWDAKKL